jgi:hypothetical protein
MVHRGLRYLSEGWHEVSRLQGDSDDEEGQSVRMRTKLFVRQLPLRQDVRMRQVN